MPYFVNSPDEAETAFYSAFSNLDMDLMRATWLDSEEIYCIHPGGPAQTGTLTVLNHWAYIFQSSRPPELEYKVLCRRQDGNLAMHLVEEILGSGSEAARVLATNTYIRDDNGWRILSHHASLPPSKTAETDVPKRIH
jgi:hypothetical protein